MAAVGHELLRIPLAGPPVDSALRLRCRKRATFVRVAQRCGAVDVSLFLPTEQTYLAEAVQARDRPRLYALYGVAGAAAGALGALASGLPGGERWRPRQSRVNCELAPTARPPGGLDRKGENRGQQQSPGSDDAALSL